MTSQTSFPSQSKVWKTKIDKKDPQFLKNHEGMSRLIETLKERLNLSLSHGEDSHVKRHLSKGQLLARERIELLLDEDSPFLEIGPLVGYGVKNCTVGGSIVAGIGLVCGIECMVSASVSTLKGGSANLATIWRSKRLGEIAIENGLPNVTLLQSGGANLTQQFDVFHVGGGAFRGIARKSKAALPSIVVLFGSCTAGGAYTPGMSDYVIMVKKQAQMYLGGPPLVKMATGEIVDDEELGGAEMHCKVSGVSDFLAQNEYHAIQLAREIVGNFNWKKKTPFPPSYFEEIEEPLYDPEELLGIVGDNIKVPFDSREVIARIVDGSRISEFKPLYGPTLITCWARIHGMPVGILANNGVLFSECANKGTQFIQLCNQINTPILFLQNITGFMVGKKYEQEGIIKNGSKLINAISNSGVPAITVVIGASYGAGNYGMCGREYKPRFLFSWPNSKCSVMGPEQLGGVLDIVFRSTLEKRGLTLTPELESMAEERKQKFIKQIEDESDVYYTSARAIDDGIIDPRDTRTILGFCLSIIHSSEIKGGNLCGVSRM